MAFYGSEIHGPPLSENSLLDTSFNPMKKNKKSGIKHVPYLVIFKVDRIIMIKVHMQFAVSLFYNSV